MYRCSECGSMFSEPESKTFCWEEYNGVEDLFGSRTYGTYDACPYCGSEEIHSYCEDEDEEFYV